MGTNRLGVDHKCRECKGCHVTVENQEDKLHDDAEKETDFLYLGDRINSGGGCEATVASRTKLGWVNSDIAKINFANKFTQKIRGSTCKTCVRSAMLYGSETWCLGQNEIGILQRTEITKMRSICGVKIVRKKVGKRSNADVGLE